MLLDKLVTQKAARLYCLTSCYFPRAAYKQEIEQTRSVMHSVPMHIKMFWKFDPIHFLHFRALTVTN
ncbi:hypothetical protein L596_009013 [Steinernema carpocapsae]|uniref:Uncharacterized protein n=1 Tax=Steinernema carpocapsae TaxID=34508 RepID=A0A4U5PEN5_STECR|nr:hypothetical protein L596_009013 [Steinernema carpocapsae]